MEIGLIITIVAAVSLLAGIIWMIFIRSGRPKYKHLKTGRYQNINVEIFSDDEEFLDLYSEKRVGVAAASLLSAIKFYPDKFSDKQIERLVEKYSRVAVAIISDRDFKKRAGVLSEYAAAVYTQYQDKIYNGWVPMVLVKESTIRGAIERTGDSMPLGSPVIHEFIHGVELSTKGGYDYSHHDSFYWKTLPNRATEIFKGLDK